MIATAGTKVPTNDTALPVCRALRTVSETRR